MNNLKEDLNKILIQLDGLKLINEVNVHYGEETTDRIPSKDPKYANDRDWDDVELNMDKVRLLTLKTAIIDYLRGTTKIYDMFDEYQLSNG